MWQPRRPTTLWAITDCYRDSFTFLFFYTSSKRVISDSVISRTWNTIIAFQYWLQNNTEYMKRGNTNWYQTICVDLKIFLARILDTKFLHGQHLHHIFLYRIINKNTLLYLSATCRVLYALNIYLLFHLRFRYLGQFLMEPGDYYGDPIRKVLQFVRSAGW
jgi:hypothetical protein